MRFLLSDESVNRYGFRVLTAGIDLSGFLKNPVMFYNHNRSTLPIGIWENVEVKQGKLLADAVFDDADADAFALQIQSKVEKGIINMTSIGFDVLEVSDDAALLVPGQKRSTVTKSALLEVSITDIGANKNAIRLSFPGKGFELSHPMDERYLNDLLPAIAGASHSPTAIKLGLSAHASQQQVNQRIDDLLLLQTRTSWSLRDWEKKDAHGLARLIKYEPQKYINLFASEYGYAPDLDQVKAIGNGLQIKEPSEDRTSWSVKDWELKDPMGWQKLLAQLGMRQAFYP